MDGGQNIQFTGGGGLGNEFVNALLANENFVNMLQKRMGAGLAKADHPAGHEPAVV